jgi:hypothetical protein
MLRVYAQLAAASAPLIEARSVGRRRPPVRRHQTTSGQLAATMDDASVANGEAALGVGVNLLEFAPSGRLDAQRFDGQFFGQFTAYSNYAFGIYTAAAGLTLDQALAGANAVAGFATYPPQFDRGGYTGYPNLLNSNYVNIVNGYGAYASGGICTSQACGGQ